MKRIVSMVCVAALAAGCTVMDITQPPIPVTAKDTRGAIGLDVYGRARAAGNPVPRFRGQEILTVRTSGPREGQGHGEIPGSTCNLDAGVYSASFQTPANIIVPDYGPDSPAIYIACTAPDGRPKSATINAVNLTSQQRNASAAGTGLLGALVIGAVNEARRDNETDDFGYNPITLMFQ